MLVSILIYSPKKKHTEQEEDFRAANRNTKLRRNLANKYLYIQRMLQSINPHFKLHQIDYLCMWMISFFNFFWWCKTTMSKNKKRIIKSVLTDSADSKKAYWSTQHKRKVYYSIMKAQNILLHIHMLCCFTKFDVRTFIIINCM